MKHVLMMGTDGSEQSELMPPEERLENAGFTTSVARPKVGEITEWKERDKSDCGSVNLTLESVAVNANLIISRNPDDIPAFSDALIEALGGAVQKAA